MTYREIGKKYGISYQRVQQVVSEYKSPIDKNSNMATIPPQGYKSKWLPSLKRSVPFHRWIMEQFLERKLLPTEMIHHKDGNKYNNDISNLQIVYSVKEHRKLHMELSRRKYLS